jgi:hypothetical protein
MHNADLMDAYGLHKNQCFLLCFVLFFFGVTKKSGTANDMKDLFLGKNWAHVVAL